MSEVTAKPRPRPSIVVSKCLEFEHCRWDGQVVTSHIVRNLMPFVDFVAVCPEVEIGLGIPRKPLRIVNQSGVLRLMQPATGLDLTEEMTGFANSFLSSLAAVDGFILKNRSPTSGIKDAKVYFVQPDKTTSKRGGPGFFGRSVLDRFPFLPVEDEGRLRNSRIKDHFLTAVFTLAWFRQVRDSASPQSLSEFQRRNRLLFEAHNREAAGTLAGLSAQYSDSNDPAVIEAYRQELCRLMARAPTCARNVDTIRSAFGTLSDRLSPEERDFFMRELQSYRAGLLPLSVPMDILKSHILRFDARDLREQTYFAPYPPELSDIDTATAHCDGRDYWT